MFDRMAERSLKNFGDPYRILKVMEKARAGEAICIAAIGGSITQRYHAASVEKCYASLVGAWWQEHFPQSKVTFVNAGIGATGSLIGVHRLQRDVLDHNPDLVVVEYSVNDYPRRNIDARDTYSNIIHRLLAAGCAVLSLDMTTVQNANTQAVHLPIAMYYEVPFVSFCDAVTPEWEQEESLKTKWEKDGTHPTDEGHKLVADLVGAYLEKLLPLFPGNYSEAEEKEPYFAVDFQKATICYADDIIPEKQGCFEIADTRSAKMPKGWKTAVNGKPLVFRFENCKRIYVLFERTNKNGGMAVADANGARTELDSSFDGGWGSYAHNTLVFSAREPQAVTLTVTPQLEEGREFALLAVMLS